jgi:hypothetical protein
LQLFSRVVTFDKGLQGGPHAGSGLIF